MKRKYPRTFLAVFLVVFLGGFGVSGATALWSVKTNLTTPVTTGLWNGFPMALTPEVRDWDKGDDWWLLWPTRRGVELSWKPQQAIDGIKYGVKAQGCSNGQREIRSGLPYDGAETDRRIQVTAPLGSAEKWVVSVTPYVYVNGEKTSGKPTNFAFSVDRYGDVSVANNTSC